MTPLARAAVSMALVAGLAHAAAAQAAAQTVRDGLQLSVLQREAFYLTKVENIGAVRGGRTKIPSLHYSCVIDAFRIFPQT